MAADVPDSDPVETREWLDSVDAVVESDGRERMGFLLDQAIDHAQEYGVKVSAGLSTPYVNTIPVEEEPPVPGDRELERLAKMLDYHCINDVPPFDAINPSAENIARWFHDGLHAALGVESTRIVAVVVWEGPFNSVRYARGQ
mgnify:CR=1 FL=1